MDETTAITPFRIDIPEADLDDLRTRLERTRWATDIPGADWDYGVSVEFVKPLVDHWRHNYDWRAWESRLNRYPQYTTTIDGQNIHFLHVKSPEPHAVPLILSHGWPGSIVEFIDLIDPLTNPRAHGGNPSVAFDLVIPSLPGFGFSGPTHDRGWGPLRIAGAWAELMKRLGYDRYGAVGNDWGTYISLALGRVDPDHVIGVHVTQIFQDEPVSPEDLAALSAEDRAAIEGGQWWEDHFGSYGVVQSQQPQTLAHAVTDSPVGLLGWQSQIFGKDFDADLALTHVMIHWLTNTAGSAMRIYFEHAHAARPTAPTTVPIGLAQFPNDAKAVRALAERDHHNIVSWNVYDRGGHFAAHDAPDLLIDDLRGFYGGLRAGEQNGGTA